MISIYIPDWDCLKFSNQMLLEISLSLFFLFALAELAGAIVSGSLLLLGDSICIGVDILSYIGNIYVEWFKDRIGRDNSRVSRWCVDIFIPLFSVVTLLAVIAYITYNSFTILLNATNPFANYDHINPHYFYAYVSIKLFIDGIVSLFFCCRGKEVFQEGPDFPMLHAIDTSLSFDDAEGDEFGHLDDIMDLPIFKSDQKVGGSQLSSKALKVLGYCFPSTANTVVSMMSPTPSNNKPPMVEAKANLNMITAFSHIFSDAFRTSVMLMSVAVSNIAGLRISLCDAYAALVVATILLIICILLLIDIINVARDMSQNESQGVELTSSSNIRSSSSSASNFFGRIRRNDPYQRVAEDDTIEDIVL